MAGLPSALVAAKGGAIWRRKTLCAIRRSHEQRSHEQVAEWNFETGE
jgi:hypothetical protein